MPNERRRALLSLVGAVLTVCLMVMALDRGEDFRSVLSCDVLMDEPTVTVISQDGPHRAVVPQQTGVNQIPVAINQTGQGQPTELVGMQGIAVPHTYPPASSVESKPQQDGSIWGSIKGALMPSAQAAEPQKPTDDWIDVNPGDWQDVQQQHQPTFTPIMSDGPDEAHKRGDYATGLSGLAHFLSGFWPGILVLPFVIGFIWLVALIFAKSLDVLGTFWEMFWQQIIVYLFFVTTGVLIVAGGILLARTL